MSASSDVDVFKMDPGTYPVVTRGVAEGLTLEQQSAYQGKELEFEDFAKPRTGAAPIVGLTPLAIHGALIQHMKTVDKEAACRIPQLPIWMGFAGRVCDIEVGVGISTNGGSNDTVNYSLLDTAAADGEIFMRLEERNASFRIQEHLRQNPGALKPGWFRKSSLSDDKPVTAVHAFTGASYNYVLGHESTETPHPMAASGGGFQRYGQRKDYEVLTVITGKDAWPTDWYADHKVPVQGKRSHEVSYVSMLSEAINTHVDLDIQKQYDIKDYAKGIDVSIAAFGLLSQKLSSAANDGRPLSLESLFKASFAKCKDNVSLFLCDKYVNLINADIGAIRGPIRAARQMERLATYQRTYHKLLTKDDIRELDAQRAYIRKEFVQPILMDQTQYALTEQALIRAGKNPESAVDPCRYKIEGIEPFDIKLAKIIGLKINAGQHAEEAAEFARNYGELDLDTRLIFTPTIGNSLLSYATVKPASKSKHKMQRGDPSVNGQAIGGHPMAPTMSYTKDTAIRVNSPGGSTHGQRVESFYNDTMPLAMGGVVSRQVLSGPGMRNDRNHIVINLKDAPGIMTRLLHDAGVFTNLAQGIKNSETATTRMGVMFRTHKEDVFKHSFQYLLAHGREDLHSQFALVRWYNDSKHYEIISCLEQRDAIEVISTANNSDVRIGQAKVMKIAEAAVQIKKAHRDHKDLFTYSNPDKITKFRVAGEPFKDDTEHVLGTIAVLGDTVHIGTSGRRGSHASFKVMPSEAPINSRALAAELTAEIDI